MRVKVYPLSANALVIVHPDPMSGKLKAEGSEWLMDGFTSRMLADGEVTLVPPDMKPAAHDDEDHQ